MVDLASMIRFATLIWFSHFKIERKFCSILVLRMGRFYPSI